MRTGQPGGQTSDETSRSSSYQATPGRPARTLATRPAEATDPRQGIQQAEPGLLRVDLKQHLLPLQSPSHGQSLQPSRVSLVIAYALQTAVGQPGEKGPDAG